MLGSDVAGEIADIINDVFANTDQVNLTFKDFNNVNGAPAYTDPPVVANGVFNETINLNATQLGNASIEYVTIATVHEVLHAYLNLNNGAYVTQLSQHQQMAEKYINGIHQYVKQLYPSMNDNDLDNIILNGFNDIFKQKPGYWNSLLNKYHTDNVAIQITSDNYKTAQSYGKHCSN